MSLPCRKFFFLIPVIVALASKCATLFETRPEKNVHFKAVDQGDVSAKKDRKVFYYIYIQKEQFAKTPSAFFFEPKKVSVHLKPGKYLFRPVRYRLVPADEPGELDEYKRANNIWQMSEPRYIKVPPDRSLQVKFGYDHGKRKVYIEQNAPGA